MSAPSRPVVVWAVLAAATVLGLWVGTGHGLPGAAAAAVVVLLAFVKIRVVGAEFMELRHAPPVLRRLFDGWVVLVGGACTVLVLV